LPAASPAVRLAFRASRSGDPGSRTTATALRSLGPGSRFARLGTGGRRAKVRVNRSPLCAAAQAFAFHVKRSQKAPILLVFTRVHLFLVEPTIAHENGVLKGYLPMQKDAKI
jgi:hypothetical protein